MPARKAGLLVLYPEYFDRSLTTSAGRRVPLPRAVEGPTARALFRALADLGHDPRLELDHSHPGHWHLRRGRVVVPRLAKGTKGALVAAVARALPGAAAALEELALQEAQRSRRRTADAPAAAKAHKFGAVAKAPIRRHQEPSAVTGRPTKKKGRRRGGFGRQR